MQKKAKKWERPHIGRCIIVAGNVTAGVVLYRLIFWKPTRVINGRHMFAKPRSELEFETGLTGKQVENALSLLRKKGLIVTGQHLFHGRNVMHAAVTAACQEALEQAGQSPQMGPPSAPDTGDSVPPNEGTSYTSYKQGEHQGELQGYSELPFGETPVIPEELAEGEGKLKPVKGFPPKPPAAKPSSVKEAILAAQNGALKAEKKRHKPEGSKGLGLVWAKAVADATGKYVPPLTLKELGLLTHLRNKCPKGKTEDVIRYAVGNWIAFVKRVETEAGIKTTPSEPKLQFLLQHAAIAVNMMAPPKPTPKVKQEAKPVALKPKPAVQLIADDDDAPMTPEELAAILNEDDA